MNPWKPPVEDALNAALALNAHIRVDRKDPEKGPLFDRRSDALIVDVHIENGQIGVDIFGTIRFDALTDPHHLRMRNYRNTDHETRWKTFGLPIDTHHDRLHNKRLFGQVSQTAQRLGQQA